MPCARARAKPSMIGGKSVPGLAKKCAMPCRLSAASSTSAAVVARPWAAAGGDVRVFAISVDLDVGGVGDSRPARRLGANRPREGLARFARRNRPGKGMRVPLGQGDEFHHRSWKAVEVLA